MVETIGERLRHIREKIEAELPVREMYQRDLRGISYSDQALWGLHEAQTVLALLDADFEEISRHHREFTCVVLMQKGMNG